MKMNFQPNAGRIAVVREADTALLRKAAGAKVILVDETVEWERRVNPWALVVGVGGPRQTDYGTTITTDVQVGEKVLVAQVGMSVWLEDGEGGDYIYVVPFEGILGRLSFTCQNCNATISLSPAENACPACEPVRSAPAKEYGTV